ncbi:MAG: hypothetical protein WAZ98_09640 [Cyclobacteriaceae bacterium]
MNSVKKAPVVNFNAAFHRVLVMFAAIIIGMMISISSQAGVRGEKDSYNHNKSVQKKKNHTYSCDVLMKKHRSSTNIVVKTNSRRPKWR